MANSQARRLFFVVNPIAGSGRAETCFMALKKLLQAEGADFGFSLTTKPGEGGTLTKSALEGGESAVIAVGGDGTVRECASAYVDFCEINSLTGDARPLFGLFPVGTGNDFARPLGVLGDADAIIGRLLRDAPRDIDMGVCVSGEAIDESGGSRAPALRGTDADVAPPESGGSGAPALRGADTDARGAQRGDGSTGISEKPLPFVNFSGFGFDVDVVKYTEKHKKRLNGLLPYMLGVFEAMLHLKPLTLTLSHDGQAPETLNALLMSVCNGTHFGGGMNAAPRSDPSDGVFDVCILKNINLAQFIWLLPRYVRGRHLSSPHICYFKAARVHVECDKRSELNFDGELAGSIGAGRTADYSIKKGALRLIPGDMRDKE